jgi:pilus assembly protein CpaB
MKKKRLVVVVLMALTSGALAGYLALGYLESQGGSLIASEPPENRLALAARDLPAGAVLGAEDIRVVPWPSADLPRGFSSSSEELVGRGLMTPLSADEPILVSKLADHASGGGLPILIPEGMRAVSVRVDEVIAVAGFVTPGTLVDVLVTISQGSGSGNSITRVILQNVRALAAGQSVQRDEEGKPQTVSVVTLLVTPEQGERLVLASNEGRIQLALRNMIDLEDITTAGIRVPQLIAGMDASGNATAGRPRAPTTTPRSPASTIIETIRGGQRTLNTFSGHP